VIVLKISELEAGMNNVTLTAEVREMGAPRDVQTKYGQNSVANAMIADDTGSIKLVLWGKQIDQVKQGATVEITGGYVNEYRNEKQLNLAKTSALKVTEGAAKEKPEEAPEGIEEEMVEEE